MQADAELRLSKGQAGHRDRPCAGCILPCALCPLRGSCHCQLVLPSPCSGWAAGLGLPLHQHPAWSRPACVHPAEDKKIGRHTVPDRGPLGQGCLSPVTSTPGPPRRSCQLSAQRDLVCVTLGRCIASLSLSVPVATSQHCHVGHMGARVKPLGGPTG